MAENETKNFLHPLTLEAQGFLKAIEKYGPQYKFVDEELLNTMDKLADAINKFYEQPLTKIEENDQLKLVKVNNLDFIIRAYTCSSCHKFLGPSAEKVARHLNNSHGVKCKPKVDKEKKQKKEHPIEVTLPKKARSLVMFSISNIFKEPLETAKQLKQLPEYELIETDLLGVVQPAYPDKTIKIFKFGSRICGIGNRNSDLDVFIEIGDNFKTFENRASMQTLKAISTISNEMHESSKWKQVIAIHNARVPIIKVEHRETHIPCDIGFSNSLGYCNTTLMEYLFDLQPLASRMCIFLKKWMERTKLNESVSTYSITLMVIYYLQLFKALPSIEMLQKDLNEPLMVGPWIGNFHRKSLDELGFEPEVFSKTTIREHMFNFFALYRDFDYEKNVICPYKGDEISIANINDELPERYTEYVSASDTPVELQLKKPIIVQDPIQLNHNVTKNISASLLRVIVAYFKDSARLISTQNGIKPNDTEENQAVE